MPIQVLLVEDSPGDIRLTREAFRGSEFSVCFRVALDGVDALAFLKHEGVHALAPRPDLILLDLDLPKMSGREVLTHIKADAELKSIPTIVLSNSEFTVDVVMSYQSQANCYLSKPTGLNEFQRLVRETGDFWFGKVLLPPRTPIDRGNDGGVSPIEQHERAVTR